MAKLTIGDKTVTIDDSFRSLSPEQQNAAVEEIAASLGLGAAPQGEDVGTPDPQIAAYTGEVLSGDPTRARSAIVQNEYEQMPWYKKPLVAADDIARLTADGITAGFTDKIGGAISGATGIGPSTDERRQNTEDARSRAGWAGTTAEVAGGIYGAGKLLKGAGAVAKAVPGVAAGANAVANAGGVVGTGLRTAGVAATGAGLGALDAAGHDRDIGTGALIGGVAGVGGKIVGEGLTRGAGKIAGLFNKQPQIMTREQIKAASTAAYKASDDAGLILKPNALQRLTQEVEDGLVKKGYHPEINPEIGSVLKELDRVGQGNVTLQGVDILRQIAGGAAAAQNAKTKALGSEIISKIDDFLDKLGTNDVLMGNKTQGVAALQNARKLWASVKKSEMIEQAIERATNQAAAAGSGGNIDNALRQQFKTILANPKLSRGLTKDEKAAMQLIVRGTKGQNLARLVGKLSPQGNGLMLLLHGTSGIASGGATVPLAAVGAGAKAIADRATPANVEQLSRIVRAGGSASATKAQKNAAQRVIELYGDRLQLPLAVGGIAAAN